MRDKVTDLKDLLTQHRQVVSECMYQASSFYELARKDPPPMIRFLVTNTIDIDVV